MNIEDFLIVLERLVSISAENELLAEAEGLSGRSVHNTQIQGLFKSWRNSLRKEVDFPVLEKVVICKTDQEETDKDQRLRLQAFALGKLIQCKKNHHCLTFRR